MLCMRNCVHGYERGVLAQTVKTEKRKGDIQKKMEWDGMWEFQEIDNVI